ncbi:DNA polymerase IV [Rhizosphaericola mali]|nr:DNA polymerase IV [Rhizosphaericola mali]
MMQEVNRHIVHMDLDSFFVSVERLKDIRLKGKPILVGGFSDRAVVASCSYEARQLGVHSAMPMRLARQLCPEATIIRGDMEEYAKYSRIVTEIISEVAPVVEKASIDEHYLDITGLDRFFGCWQWTRELRQRIIDHTGLPISFGLSINKTVSKIATGQAKPDGELQVPDGTEKIFLSPLSIRKIPMVGEKTYISLRNMGISKIGTLQQMELPTMAKVMGQNGIMIWKKANALDDAPVTPYSEQKSMSKETTFEQDTTDMEKLRKVLFRMVDELAFELRSMGKITGCLTLKIRYANFDTHTKQIQLPYTASDKVILEKVMDLFRKLYSRRMLIRLVGIRLSQLIHGSFQTDMFNDKIEELNLLSALDNIRVKYGQDIIKRAFLQTKDLKDATQRS